MKRKIVVIGNGMAGARIVEEILKRTTEKFDIVMFGAEPYGNYNRILLSHVLNKTRDPDGIMMNPLSWYRENGITLHAGVKAVHIDRVRKIVLGKIMPPGLPAYERVKYQLEGASAVEEPYDYLIIATGSRPFVPPVEGFGEAGQEGTFLFRTIDDCHTIAEYAKGCRKAVVIGGGLLGLEAARGLMTHSLDVTVVEAAPHLMPAQLDQEAGRLLQKTMEGLGVHVLTNAMTTRIVSREGKVSSLLFKDGHSIETDMVVVSAGIRPITELAVNAGLEVNKGIVCDDQMRTSDADIFALGECMEHQGMLYGLVEPIWEQARVLADVITAGGVDAVYEGTRTGTKLKVMGVELVSLGEK